MEKFKLTKMDPSELHKEILEFQPESCLACDFDGDILLEYFLITPNFETENEFNEIKKEVKSQFGYESFSELGSDFEGQLISACRCPVCGSEEIFEDI